LQAKCGGNLQDILLPSDSISVVLCWYSLWIFKWKLNREIEVEFLVCI
jgi:hypothetical protein